MSRKNILPVVILAALLLAGSFTLAARMTHAQNQGMNSSEISAKLDQVLEGQRALMNQMASLKQELNIIKIRITQSQ